MRANIPSDQNLYDSFGAIATLGGTTFGFTGQRFYSELGLCYFKRRYYSPNIGRFLQPDPTGYTGEELNLYTYVQNSPLRFVDPMGLQNGGSGMAASGTVGHPGAVGSLRMV